LLAKNVAIFAQAEGKTMIEDNVPAKLKHLSAQVAMAAQSSMTFSHGLALGGQQSGMSSITDAGFGGLTLAPAPPAMGRIATERATRSTRMDRPTFMDQLSLQKIAGLVIRGSNDDFAIRFSPVSVEFGWDRPAIVQPRAVFT
jgi:hypothetical protein